MRKNIITLLLVLVALFSADLSAQTSSRAKAPVKHGETPKGLQWSQSKSFSSKGGFKVPVPFRLPKYYSSSRQLAKSVGDGTIINGCVIAADNWTEESTHYGIYTFAAKGEFTVTPVIENPKLNSGIAVYAKGKYYKFAMQQMFGMLFEISCTVYNAETWEELNMFSNDKVWSNVPFSSSMAYDPVSGNVYGITYGSNAGSFYLSIMDIDNGTFTRVCDLQRGLITLAAAPDGTLYGISEDGMLCKLDKKDGKETIVGPTGLLPKYVQSMTCDPATGKLYWAFINDSESALYEVNTQTGMTYKIDDMPNFQEVVGMYIKAPVMVEAAPAIVSDLKFIPDKEGSLTGTLSCVAPTKNQKGSDLSGKVKVAIYAANNKIVEQEVAPGAVVREDNYAFKANELYTLYAIASNTSGESPKKSITVFIGKDNAGAPSDVLLSVSGKNATLNWKAPTKGLSDGYIDPAQVSYKIVRHAGDDEGVLVATTGAGVTTCTDILPSVTAQYFYAVTAIYNGNKGGTALSNKVLSVGAYELPFYDDFSNGDLCNALYTYLDIDKDGHDNQSMWFWKADEKLMQFCADKQHVGNDWLITPAIHLDGKNLYDLEFSINMGAPSNLKVTIGTSTDPKDHSTILDLNNIQGDSPTPHSAVVKAPKDGNYYIGFYAYSGLQSFYLNLFNVSLKAGGSSAIPDSVYSLKIIPAEKGGAFADLSFNAPKTLVNGTSISKPFKVNIYRNDKLAKEFDVTPGQTITWKDETPVMGLNAYRLVAVMDKTEGFPNSKTIWVGPDLSEPVKDVVAKTIDGNMHVSLNWKAPEKGANNGYFKIEDISYSVWRSLDGEEYTKIVDNLKALTYTDTQIEQELKGKQEGYYYAVTADTRSGNSGAEAVFVVVGTPYKIPVLESFPKGQFNISPWTTESLEGSFSFECRTNDKSAGVYPQDNDKGFTKFINDWSDKVDCRLKTPIMDLSGSKNPSFSFFMFHWNASDVEEDGGNTKLEIEISVDGGEFKKIGETITAAYNREGWVEHRISVADYKNAKHVQFAFRGMTNNNWMYYYIDNIHVEEQDEFDLAVSKFEGSTNVNINEEGVYNLEYFNRGLKAASGYTIDLYQDNNLIQSLKGEEIQPGEIKNAEFKVVLNASKAGKESAFNAIVTYDKDQNTDNNQSTSVSTTVKGVWYPVVEGLKGTVNGKEITLSWTAPIIPTNKEVTEDGVEDYEPFAIDHIGDWVTYDGDERYCGSMQGLPDYSNKGVNQAFQVWAPSYLEGVTAENFPTIQPRTGDQCFISWYANLNLNDSEPFNDDYLISPPVLGGTKVSFYIHRINEKVTEEYYQVMYSTTTQNPEDFKVLWEGEAGFEWEKVEVTLPADARYFAIHYIAVDTWGIVIDDISYTSGIYRLKVNGYNIFRDGVKINETMLTNPTFVDSKVSEGKHLYQVSVIYNEGESDGSEAVELSLASGINEIESGVHVYGEGGHITVITENMRPVSIYTVDGKFVMARDVVGKANFSVEMGLYIVKVGDKVTKVVVNE